MSKTDFSKIKEVYDFVIKDLEKWDSQYNAYDDSFELLKFNASADDFSLGKLKSTKLQ